MNSDQIRTALRNLRGFDGVYSANNLPSKRALPLLLISNTRPNNHPGEHWISVAIDSQGVGKYFDSYGLEAPTLLRDFMNSKMYLLDF